jgi:hypothetical protein
MAGLSFAPSASLDRRTQQQNRAALGSPAQALQVLSLHLPRILGARALSPASLLNPQPGGAPPVSPDAAVLQSALQAGRAGMGAPSSPLAPSPNAVSRGGVALPPAQPGLQTSAPSNPFGSPDSAHDVISALFRALAASPQNGGYSGGAPLPRVVTGLEAPGVTPSNPMPVAGTAPTPAQALAQTLQRALMGGVPPPIVPQSRRV